MCSSKDKSVKVVGWRIVTVAFLWGCHQVEKKIERRVDGDQEVIDAHQKLDPLKNIEFLIQCPQIKVITVYDTVEAA